MSEAGAAPAVRLLLPMWLLCRAAPGGWLGSPVVCVLTLLAPTQANVSLWFRSKKLKVMQYRGFLWSSSMLRPGRQQAEHARHQRQAQQHAGSQGRLRLWAGTDTKTNKGSRSKLPVTYRLVHFQCDIVSGWVGCPVRREGSCAASAGHFMSPP